MERAILSAKKTLTTAQVKALVATDVEVIAAPGAGKAIVVLGAFLTMRPVASPVQYAWANTDHDITIGGHSVGGDTPAQALIEAATTGPFTKQVVPAGKTLTANEAVVIGASGTGEPATGNGELDIEVLYMVIDVTE